MERLIHHLINDFGFVVERLLLYGSLGIVGFRVIEPDLPDWLLVSAPILCCLFAAKRRVVKAAADYGYREAVRAMAPKQEETHPRPQQWPTTGRV